MFWPLASLLYLAYFLLVAPIVLSRGTSDWRAFALIMFSIVMFLPMALQSPETFTSSDDFITNIAMVEDFNSAGKYPGYQIVKLIVPYFGAHDSLVLLWSVSFTIFVALCTLYFRLIPGKVIKSISARVLIFYVFILFIVLGAADGLFGCILPSKGFIGSAHFLFQSVSIVLVLGGAYLMAGRKKAPAYVVFILAIAFHYSSALYVGLLLLGNTICRSYTQRANFKVIVLFVAVIFSWVFSLYFHDIYSHMLVFIGASSIAEDALSMGVEGPDLIYKCSVFSILAFVIYPIIKSRLMKKAEGYVNVPQICDSQPKSLEDASVAVDALIFLTIIITIMSLMMAPSATGLAYRLVYIVYVCVPILITICLTGLYLSLVTLVKSRFISSSLR